jgi:hypothetical protein
LVIEGFRITIHNQRLVMNYVDAIPLAVAAYRYSLAYLLLGGGVFGAIGVYIVAKLLGK